MPFARITFPQPHKDRLVGDVVEVDADELRTLIRDGKAKETTGAAKSRTRRSTKVEDPGVPTSAPPPSSE